MAARRFDAPGKQQRGLQCDAAAKETRQRLPGTHSQTDR
jgi:hypothetical protein